MSVKMAIEKFFSGMLEGYSKTEEGYPVIPYVDHIDSMIYIGEQDKDGWIRWNPIKKDKNHDLKDIEEELEISINKDIKDYFNSYWFICIEATFKSYDITLNGVVPSEREYGYFKRKLREYKNNHGGELKYIPLGSEVNAYTIVVENETGKVKFEDYETGKYKTVSNSLEEFISKLKPVII